MEQPAKTAVSLLSGATEAIFALGLEAQLIGRSHECDYPAEPVAALPACSRELVDPSDTAANIDAQVKQLSESGEPLYRLEAATVGALAPDEVVILRPKTLQDVMDDIVTVASARRHRQRGVDYVTELQGRLTRLARPLRISYYQMAAFLPRFHQK